MAPDDPAEPGDAPLPARSRRPMPALCADDAAAGLLVRFRRVVGVLGGELAVADDRDALTFTDVAAEAARVVHGIRREVARLDPPPAPGGHDVFGAPEPVALIGGHTAWTVAALLGVIASGHPVLVLDQRTPVPRLRQFVERAGARLVVTDEAHEEVARELGGHVLVPRRDVPDTASTLLWADPPVPSAVAALAFTSGSTGTPKLVANCHRMLTRDAWTSATATGCYGPDDVIAHTLPFAFHAGLTTTVHGLLVGATMRLYDARTRGIGALPAWIAQHRATIMISSPSILRAFTGTGPDPALLTSLRSVNLAGEAVYPGDIAALTPLLAPECAVRSRYGSSETGLIAEYVIGRGTELGERALPVGLGVGDTRIRLVTEDGAPVAGEDQGIVTVNAPYVALGYWNNVAATGEVFRTEPDGTRTYRSSDVGRILPDVGLRLAGRADHSVKIRGYLVDPGEVDAVLFGVPQVREAVTVGVPRATGGHRLAAYVAPADVDVQALRTALRGLLPGHMVPEVIVSVEALPRTERGKIDRASLPPPSEEATGPEDGLTGWQELVAAIWADVLERPTVRLADDFFALGGDSLAAEAMISRVISELNVAPEVASTALLVRAPVLSDFAAGLQRGARAGDQTLVPLNPRGTRLPLFLVAGGGGLGVAFVPWSRRLGEDQPTYALQSPVVEGRGLPDRSVEALARHHLRRVRAVQPHGPYQIGGHSFGGLVAFEMAQQLVAAGEEVDVLAILDSFPPHPAFHPAAPEVSPLQRAKSLVGLTLAALRPTQGASEHWRFFDQSGDLGRRYFGHPYGGRTLLVVADTPEREQRSAWANFLTGEVTRVNIDADHLSMARPPASDIVADALAEVMTRARAERAARSGVAEAGSRR